MTRRVAIVGAGITGLVCARALQKCGVECTVFEAAPSVGGPIRTLRRGGFLAERGPHTLMTSNETLTSLIDDLGLTDRTLRASPKSRKRYMVRDGRPTALPMSPGELIQTGAFSTKAKLALLREPFVPRRDDGVDESVTNFIKRRLDRELLDYGLELLVNGVWAGDPDRLSIRYAFPKLHALERDHGSLIRGGIARARARGASSRPEMVSFVDGNQTLTDALAAEIDDLRTERSVRTVRRDGRQWRVRNGAYDDVVFTVSAPDLAEMALDDAGPVDTSFLREIAYPSVAIVTLGFRRQDVRHPLDGFGMIAPAREGLDILGALFTSSLFEGRAPPGHVTIGTFVGGMRRPDLASLTDEERLERTLRALRPLLGIEADPVFVAQSFWARALPQYEVGYGRLLARMEALERKHRGLWIAGNIRQGVAVPDLIEAGAQLARTIVETK